MSAAWKKCGSSGLPDLVDSEDEAGFAPTEIAPLMVDARSAARIRVLPVPSDDEPRIERTLLMPSAPRLRAVAAVPTKRHSKTQNAPVRELLLAVAIGTTTFLFVVGTTLLLL